jgi:hypothetical protein
MKRSRVVGKHVSDLTGLQHTLADRVLIVRFSCESHPRVVWGLARMIDRLNPRPAIWIGMRRSESFDSTSAASHVCVTHPSAGGSPA